MIARPTVFLVDDDSAVLDSIRILLELSGLAVKSFGSGEEFLTALEVDKPTGRGCVVLDYNLPGLNGLEVLSAMPAGRIDLPVIVISGRIDAAARRRVTRAGAVAVLDKPMREERLLDLIRASLGSGGPAA